MKNMQDRVTDVIQEQVPSTELLVHHVLSHLLENLQTPPANIASLFHNRHSIKNVTPPT
jgi:hypothetical protein